MKKRVNAKEKRELRKQQQKERFRLENEAKTPAAVTEDKKEGNGKAEEKAMIPGISPKKSSAKAAGVKSAFILSENRVLMTSFGKGNQAVLEKKIEGERVDDLNDRPVYSAFPDGAVIGIKGWKDGTVDNPLHVNDENITRAPGSDILGLKDKLEARYFPNDAPFDDNIHIQLIYNILDIEKILAPFVNNTIYVINNLTRSEGREMDLIGNIHEKNSYDTFMAPESKISGKEIRKVIEQREYFNKIVTMPQRLYLGEALYNTRLKKGQKEDESDRKRYYYTLYLLGRMRQSLFHGFKNEQSMLYTIDKKFDSNSETEDLLKARKEARETLDGIYSVRIKKLNEEFLNLAKKDLAVLFRMYGAKTPEQKEILVREYYDFTIHKEYKTLGFSLKVLREKVFASPEGASVKNSCHQSMWHKFVKNFDYIAYHHYKEQPEEAASIVEALRSSMEDAEKDGIYSAAAGRLWESIRPVVTESLLPVMDPERFKHLTEDGDVNKTMLNGVSIGTDVHYFSKLMYMLTMFLNGKEINELLTKLINKFESIDSFNSILSSQGLSLRYEKWYGMFLESGEIAKELRTINSFARMQKEDPDAKKTMYVEAAQIFGFNDTDEALSDYIEYILTKDPVKKAELQSSIRKSSFPLPNEGFRNFIANNVVESTKFKYLVRYTNPARVSVIAHNDQILKFVLGNIPDEQIERYYRSCIEDASASPEAMRDSLRHLIKGVSFTDFADVNQKSNAEQNEDKRKKQSIIGLYLAVIYLAVKNLVNINSRYTLAFHCFERDYALIKKHGYDKNNESYKCLTEEYIELGKLNKKACRYLKQNLSNAYNQTIRFYRNEIDHLTVLRDFPEYVRDVKKVDSYFALYHYLVQRSLKSEYEHCKICKSGLIDGNEPVTESYFADVAKYGKYRKDFVKALNVPFGYNLPRYKNLSIEGLFDMNYPGDKGCTGPDDSCT